MLSPSCWLALEVGLLLCQLFPDDLLPLLCSLGGSACGSVSVALVSPACHLCCWGWKWREIDADPSLSSLSPTLPAAVLLNHCASLPVTPQAPRLTRTRSSGFTSLAEVLLLWSTYDPRSLHMPDIEGLTTDLRLYRA